MKCNCGAMTSDLSEWTSVPECSNGRMLYLCPVCGAKAAELAKALVELVGTSNAHLFSFHNAKGYLHDPAASPPADLSAPEIQAYLKQVGFAPLALRDMNRATMTVRVHRFECGCGQCKNWSFEIEGARQLGYPYKLTPEDAGMALVDGMRLQVTFERLTHLDLGRFDG